MKNMFVMAAAALTIIMSKALGMNPVPDKKEERPKKLPSSMEANSLKVCAAFFIVDEQGNVVGNGPVPEDKVVQIVTQTTSRKVHSERAWGIEYINTMTKQRHYLSGQIWPEKDAQLFFDKLQEIEKSSRDSEFLLVSGPSSFDEYDYDRVILVPYGYLEYQGPIPRNPTYSNPLPLDLEIMRAATRGMGAFLDALQSSSPQRSVSVKPEAPVKPKNPIRIIYPAISMGI